LIHEGSLEVFVLDEGVLTLHRLGNDWKSGERPSITLPAGALQAARLAAHSEFAFGSNVCAPPFTYEAMNMPSRAELLRDYPEHERLIVRLTHATG
jgi:hypothetical protein